MAASITRAVWAPHRVLASSSALQGVKVCWQTDLLTGISAPDETL